MTKKTQHISKTEKPKTVYKINKNINYQNIKNNIVSHYAVISKIRVSIQNNNLIQ